MVRQQSVEWFKIGIHSPRIRTSKEFWIANAGILARPPSFEPCLTTGSIFVMSCSAGRSIKELYN